LNGVMTFDAAAAAELSITEFLYYYSGGGQHGRGQTAQSPA